MEHNERSLDVWGGGQLLAFSGIDGKTSYHEGLVCRTRFDGLGGIDVKEPGTAVLQLGRVQRGADVFLAGDHVSIATPNGTVRAAFVDTYHLAIDGPCSLDSVSESLRISKSADGRRALLGARGHFDERHLATDMDALFRERGTWLRERPLPARASGSLRRALMKAYSQIKTMIYAPEGAIRHRFSTPDRWPHKMMWLWDTAFHAIGIRRIDPALARECIDGLFDTQEKTGRIALCADPWKKHESFTQPPLLALAASLVDEVDPAPGWIEAIYPRLSDYLEWDLSHRDTDSDGLLEWAVSDDPSSRSGESGMDNSPRFDAARRVNAADFNAFMSSECEVMARFAERLGRPSEAMRWRDRAVRLNETMNRRLWNDEMGIYVDARLAPISGPAQIIQRSCAGLMPLICGAPDETKFAMLRRALTDPDVFGTPVPVPTIARGDAAYAPDMWRGPVWINVNWLVARGLDRYGAHEEATALRERSVQEIARWYETYGTLFEFFDADGLIDPPQLLRKGECAPEKSPFRQVFFDYGWTATLLVDMAFALAE